MRVSEQVKYNIYDISNSRPINLPDPKNNKRKVYVYADVPTNTAQSLEEYPGNTPQSITTCPHIHLECTNGTKYLHIKEAKYSLFEDILLTKDQADGIYQKLVNTHHTEKQRFPSPWLKGEIKLLQWSIFAITIQKNIYIHEFIPKNWEEVALFVPYRTSEECLKQWNKTQKPPRLLWTEVEDDFLSAIIRFKSQFEPLEENPSELWDDIASEMSRAVENKWTLTRKKCKKRWTNLLQPSIAPITLREEIFLLDNYLICEHHWSTIGEIMHRSAYWVKNHIKRLLRNNYIIYATTFTNSEERVEYMNKVSQARIKLSSPLQLLRTHKLSENSEMS